MGRRELERSEIEDGPQVLRRGTSGINQIASQVEMESNQREPGDAPAILRKGGHRCCNQRCAKCAMQQKVVVTPLELWNSPLFGTWDSFWDLVLGIWDFDILVLGGFRISAFNPTDSS
jgi:hypothetical protein